jgi:hypothetical protein
VSCLRLSIKAAGSTAYISFPRPIWAFVDVFRARDSPRHSPSYRLTTLIAEIESMGVRATSAEGHRVPRLVPAQLGYPVGADTPFEEILMKRKLNLALWIVAGILAVVFLVASSTKLFVPKEKLATLGGASSDDRVFPD